MSYVMVRHKVGDYAKWKTIFDGDFDWIGQSGCQRFGLYKASSDSNDLVVFLEWDSLENARRFFESDKLKQRMSQGGVTGAPEIVFLDQLEKKMLHAKAA